MRVDIEAAREFIQRNEEGHWPYERYGHPGWDWLYISEWSGENCPKDLSIRDKLRSTPSTHLHYHREGRDWEAQELILSGPYKGRVLFSNGGRGGSSYFVGRHLFIKH